MSSTQSKCECYAIIDKVDPRHQIWMEVFGKPQIPLKNPLAKIHPQFGAIYDGDPSKLTKQQKEKMADILSEKFGLLRKAVLSDLAKGNLAVKADNISISICELHMRCMM